MVPRRIHQTVQKIQVQAMQIRLNGGSLYQMFRHPGQMNSPTNSKNSATILSKLHKDRLLKVTNQVFQAIRWDHSLINTTDSTLVEDNEREGSQ